MCDVLTNILLQSDNNICADCDSCQNEFVSLKVCVFICKNCAVFHKKLFGPDSVRVLNEAVLSKEELESLHAGGNSKVRSDFEASLPPFYCRPSAESVECMREEFIRAKYSRKEFVADSTAKQIDYATQYKRGILLKKLRDSSKYVERTFELNLKENYLRYFIKPDSKDPKASLDMEKLNATFVDDSVFKVPKNTLAISYLKDGSTRNVFVYTEDSKTIVDWYNAIRFCKFHRLYLHLSGMGQEISVSEVADQLTFDYGQYGWLEKTGPRSGDAWRRRWCVLARRKLMYSEDSVAAFAKGEIFIGSAGNGFSVEIGAPPNWKKHAGYALTLITPDRPYVFHSTNETDRNAWAKAIQRVIDAPLSLQESKEAAGFTPRRTSSFDLLKKKS